MSLNTMSLRKESKSNDAYTLFRQHFTDLYGAMPEGNVERLISAERRDIADVTDRCRFRAKLRRWRDDFASQSEQNNAPQPSLS